MEAANARIHESNLELFKIRMTTKLCIAIVCLLQLIPRIMSVAGNAGDLTKSDTITLISSICTIMVAVVIAFEYFWFRTRGPGILKYSQIIDIILLLLFLADWIGLMIASLVKLANTDPPTLKIAALFGFTSFSWKTLLVTLMVSKWQIKMFAPVAALSVATGYVIYYDPHNLYYILVRYASQAFNIVFIIYVEDKLKWKMIWTNLQQEKWMQTNNFILNNIPENIMILDVRGEARYISDYCKSFMEKCGLSLNPKDLFVKIRDLQEQKQNDTTTLPTNPSTNNIVQIERLTTCHELLGETANQQNPPPPPLTRAEPLEDVINNFKKIAVEKNLQERQFLVYNGKLKLEENQQEKAIEIKISFIQHFENFYVILILRDTTQHDLLITLQETNKYKDQLLASVSHELRAPLNGNINLVETAITSPKIPEHIKESLLVPALRSSKFLLHIINDILDMSQIKEKKLRLIFRSENLQETLKSVVQLVELQAKKKAIELVLELDPELPLKFCTDHIRLSQIVLNLLNNAIKFTKRGTVKLTVSSIPDTPQCVKINVEDSGIGMTPENVKNLFSSYTHIEFEGRKFMNPTGVGLGLNIAFNLAELLGPKDNLGITVVSVPNQGSVFSFIIEDKQHAPTSTEEIEMLQNASESGNIPCEDIKPMFIPRLKTLNSSNSISMKSEPELLLETCLCPRILIVDDNPFNTMAFETILGSLDIKCDSVYSGASAIDRLLGYESKRCCMDCKLYSVVFMDQEMPEMSGAEATREIRRLQREGRVPAMKIIGCTAHKSKEEVDKFLQAGLDQCIHKPISTIMIKDIL